jgi:hypothetical protein
MCRLGDDILSEAEDICAEAQQENLYFVPIIVIAAVRDGEPAQLLASNCVFSTGQPIEEIARLLGMTSRHLVGDNGPDDGIAVERSVINGGEQ